MSINGVMVHGHPATRGNSLALTIGAGLVLLFVVGVILSITRSTSDIVADADALHDADESLRGVTIVRAQVELVALQTRLIVDPAGPAGGVIAHGLQEAQQALEVSKTGIADVVLHGTSPGLVERSERFFDSASVVLTSLVAGQIPPLDTFRMDSDALSVALNGVRGELAAAVSDSDRGLTSMGSLAGFLVAFAIPAGIVLTYRELSRRQIRQRELEVHLDAERSINSGRERFIATASHELRSPLTTVVGMAHLLAEVDLITDDPDLAEMVTLMISEAEDLTRLVEDLLTASRIEADAIHYAFETVDIIAEMDTLVSPFRSTTRPIAVDVAPGAIRVDRLRFRQMVRNLISNARKYGGPNITIQGRIRGDTYIVSVIDDGAGVSEELAPRLFERFVHRGRETAGTHSVGLGLSIVMALAVGMGGTVYYDRKDDRTVFAAVLPLAALEATEGIEPARLAS